MKSSKWKDSDNLILPVRFWSAYPMDTLLSHEATGADLWMTVKRCNWNCMVTYSHYTHSDIEHTFFKCHKVFKSNTYCSYWTTSLYYTDQSDLNTPHTLINTISQEDLNAPALPQNSFNSPTKLAQNGLQQFMLCSAFLSTILWNYQIMNSNFLLISQNTSSVS